MRIVPSKSEARRLIKQGGLLLRMQRLSLLIFNYKSSASRWGKNVRKETYKGIYLVEIV